VDFTDEDKIVAIELAIGVEIAGEVDIETTVEFTNGMAGICICT
jgi:hypothetical protein